MPETHLNFRPKFRPKSTLQPRERLREGTSKTQRWRRTRRRFLRPCLANHPRVKILITVIRISPRTLQTSPGKTLAGNPSEGSTVYGSAETSSLRKSNSLHSPQSKKVFPPSLSLSSMFFPEKIHFFPFETLV